MLRKGENEMLKKRGTIKRTRRGALGKAMAFLLALVMVMGMMPTVAFADAVAKVSGTVTYNEDVNSNNIVLKLTGDTTLVLNGVTVKLWRIEGDYNLTIKGTGALMLDSRKHGIETKSLTVNGGYLRVSSSNDGINVKNDVHIRDGKVYAGCGSGYSGIYTKNGNVIIDGGTVDVGNPYFDCTGICASQGSIRINGGVLNSDSDL